MIKDIVVNLSVGEKASPACDYAISVAATFDAHLAGIAFLYDPIVPVSGAGYIPADVIEAQERDNEEATGRPRPLQRGLRARRRQRRAADLECELRRRRRAVQPDRAAVRLSIVGQSEPETSAIEEIIAEVGVVRIRPAGDRRSLHPKGAAQARQRDGVLGRQPRRRTRHRRLPCRC